jgi:probable F420-dependent oxidoreductase
MKFGFVVPNNFGVADPADVISLAVQAEDIGFDSVWVNHHVLNIGYVHDRLGQRPYHDAIVMLTWIASKTSRVRLGTSVLVLPYLHPMVLAKELATLDQLSGGRLVVGVGVGSLPEENTAMGVDYEGRGKYTDEFLEVMIKLWTQKEASFDGEHFEFENVVASPKPLQQPHPPILIGGNRPPALRRVARLGDGFHPLGVSPEGLRERLVTIRAEAAAVERDDVPGEVSIRLNLDDVDLGLVAEYSAAGATELVVSMPTGDVDEIREGIERFAADIISTIAS